MTIKLTLALVIGFGVSVIFGRFYIPWLRRIHAGQEIKSNGPAWHQSKAGTPTMGGVMFIVAVLVVCLTVGFDSMVNGRFVHIFVLLFSLAFGAIGFLDDWEKLRKKQNLGLTSKMKFLLQVIVAFAFIWLMRRSGFLSTNLYIPFFNKSVLIPGWIYYPLAVFIVVGTVNSVNITDGIDGLAAGTSIPVFLFFVALTFFLGPGCLELGIFASALVGGLLGFLVYNFNPAKVFMGDTGSLFLGGAVAALAIGFDMPLILITLGIIYLIETLSDIIQVVYFKLTHGKRVFRMAPLHHHLEMGGWSGHKWKEKELFALFAGVSLLFAVLSFIGVYHRYI